MGSSKSTGGRFARTFAAATALAKSPFRKALPLALFLGLVGWGLHVAWDRWGAPATKATRYLLPAEQMDVSPQPNWIHADVKEEVIRDGQLADLELLDPQLTEKISRAFSLHSWVAKVVQVRKEYPGRIHVELEYRQPVAMVEVVSSTGPGLLFIDNAGVLLPSEDFALRQTQDFLRIQAPHTAPAGIYGTAWGDPRIERAARLAAVLAKDWQNLKLYRVRAVEMPGNDLIFELEAKDGQIVRWGHAPGEEVPPERSTEDKLRFLQVAPVEQLPATVDGLP